MKIHIRNAIANIRRSPFQALAAITTLTVTFFVLTSLSIAVYSSDKLINYFETRPQVIAFLKNDSKAENVTVLQQKLMNDIRVKDIKYVSKEEALDLYKKSTTDNPLLSELVSPAIFPASLEFSLVDLKFATEVINEVKQDASVDQVGFTANLSGESGIETTIDKLKSITNYVRLGGLIAVSILTLTSILVLLIVISMRMLLRRDEVEILNLIGATSGFVRSPILMESFIYSFMGTFIGWALAFILSLYISPSLIGYFSDIPILPKNTSDFVLLFLGLLVVELLLSSFIAFSASMLVISRVKRNK